MLLNIHEKCTDEKINKLEDRVEVVEYAGSFKIRRPSTKINTGLKSEISYLKSQQMRSVIRRCS